MHHVEEAGWQLSTNIRNVQLSSLRHPHFAYQRRWSENRVHTTMAGIIVTVRSYNSPFVFLSEHHNDTPKLAIVYLMSWLNCLLHQRSSR